MAGKLVHWEFPADDAGRATSFWNSLFGWDFEEYEGSGYHMTQSTEPGGALQARQEGQTGVTVYFDTDDVEATSEKVKSIGGTVRHAEEPGAEHGLLRDLPWTPRATRSVSGRATSRRQLRASQTRAVARIEECGLGRPAPEDRARHSLCRGGNSIDTCLFVDEARQLELARARLRPRRPARPAPASARRARRAGREAATSTSSAGGDSSTGWRPSGRDSERVEDVLRRGVRRRAQAQQAFVPAESVDVISRARRRPRALARARSLP